MSTRRSGGLVACWVLVFVLTPVALIASGILYARGDDRFRLPTYVSAIVLLVEVAAFLLRG